MRRSTLEECGSLRRSTLEEWDSRSSCIDSILENGCISRCSLDEQTGALRLYVRRNTRDSSSSSSSSSTCIETKRACRKSKLHLGYRPKVRHRKPPCAKPKPPCAKPKPPCSAPRTQIVKEQNVQTEITISADVDMWETREYCRCDLRDGRSESPEPCPPPPCPPPPPPREVTPEPQYNREPPPKEENPHPSREKAPPHRRKRRKQRRNSRLAFRNYNIAFQRISLNSQLPDEMRHLQNYYVTQDPHYKLKFEKSRCSLRNELRKMKEITLCRSDGGKEYEHQPGKRKIFNGPKRDHLKTSRSKERSGFMLDDDRLYIAWNAFCESFLRYLTEDKIPARREDLKPDKCEAEDAKEGKKSQKGKGGRKSHKEKKRNKSNKENRKREDVESKTIKKQEVNRAGPTNEKKRGGGDNIHRLGFVN